MRQAISLKGKPSKPNAQSGNLVSPNRIQQMLAHLQEIDNMSLSLAMINPSYARRHARNNQQTSDIAWDCRPLYQALHMDLTSYQTLKQLIVQNKPLVNESQSAYFLSKQASKLIGFIDGYRTLQGGEQLKERTTDIYQETINKQNQNYKNQYQPANKFMGQYGIQAEDQTNSAREEERLQKKTKQTKQTRKLSQKPALIRQQQDQDEYLIQKKLESDEQPQIHIQVQASYDSPELNENDMNTSNIIITSIVKENPKTQNTTHKQPPKPNPTQIHKHSKVIRLYTNTNNQPKSSQLQQSHNQNPRLNTNHPKKYNFHQQNLNKKQQDLNKNQQNQMNQNLNPISHNQIADLSQIIRPQYQKTEISMNSSSSLDGSSQSLSMAPYEETNEEREVNNQSVTGKKKSIPLLKKGKLSVGYNELISATKLVNQSRLNSTISIYQNPQQVHDKDIVSQDTDANSRLSTLTNQGISVCTRQDNKAKQQNRISLSPKVQKLNQKKKVLIKRNPLSHHTDSRIQNEQFMRQQQDLLRQEQGQGLLRQKHEQNQDLTQESQMQIELRELEQQFMNRKQAKQSQSSNLEVEHSQDQSSNQQPHHESLPKPAPKQNKTLQLIKKSSTHFTNTQPLSKSNDHPFQNDHLPLTSNSLMRKHPIRMQKHSIVLEEEPWECDQLQLQEELKALDVKIQGRKSMLSLHHTAQTLSSQATHHYQYQHQSINKSSDLQSHHQAHKRSNTSHIPTYKQHLFDENQELFERNQGEHEHQNQHQPKVVRLSLNALTSIVGRQSREGKSTRHVVGEKERGTLIKKEQSRKQLRKEPSCKSILLYEEAEKRGISPSKSAKSLKSHNNTKKSISPIKHIPLHHQPQTPKIQRQTPTNYVNQYNKSSHTENTPHNQHSRTLSDIADLQDISRAQLHYNPHHFMEVNNCRVDESKKGRAWQRNDENRNILNHTQYVNMTGVNQDGSTLSNCERYFESEQQQPNYGGSHGYYKHQQWPRSNQQAQKYQQLTHIPAKKWFTHHQAQNKGQKRNRMVLLSDQLGDC